MAAYLMRRYEALGKEDRVIVLLLLGSFLVHVVILFASFGKSFLHREMPQIQEWEIQADLFVGDENVAAEKSALPRAEEADKAAIPETLLPQLTKTTTVKASTPEEETDAEVGEKSKTDDKSQKEIEEKNKQQILTDKNKDNKINQEDFIKRSALERLRQEQQFAKRLQAEQRSAIAKLKGGENKPDGNAGDSLGALGGQVKSYMGRLKMHVNRCYTVPEIYRSGDKKFLTVLGITLTEKGDVSNLGVLNPSGDKAFDEIAYKAVKDCAPMPSPPRGVAGKQITFNFSPM